VFAIALLLCLFAASIVQAQVISATIRGKVVDQQGAVLPGVTITARETTTNLSRSTVTTSVGQFFLPNLPAGKYELTVELTGFASIKRAMELTVGEDTTLPDFTLKVGTVSESITVQGEAPMIETTKTVLGSTIQKDQVDNLPTVNRDFTSLALLVPGVTGSATGHDSTDLAMNGQQGYQNNIFIDGASNIWQYYGTGASTFSQDWIQEFQVMTNSYSAEFGTASGGILNVITRSGSNAFHGRAYGFFQRKGWDSMPFAGTFNNNDVSQPQFLSSSEVPDYSQRRWGGYLGGPVLKDRLFFFAGYEDLLRQSTSALAISDYWREQGVPTTVPIETTDHPFIVKADANLGPSNRLSVRFDRTIRKLVNEANEGGDALTPLAGRDTFGGPVWTAIANLSSTVSNTSFNEFRTYYMSNMPPIVCHASGTGGMGDLALGPPGTFAWNEWPTMMTGCPVFDGTEGEQNFSMLDHYSFVKGHHQFKFGGQAKRNVLNDNITNFHNGEWRFAQDLAFNINDPDSYPYRFVGNVGPGAFKIPSWEFAAFAQDTWQVRDDLTLSLGVRYDLDYSVTDGNQYVDQKNAEIVSQLGGAPLLQKTNVDPDEIAPRLGFVWTPTKDKNTTVRGAVGMFYDENHGNFNAIYIINTLVGNLTVINANNPRQNPFWNAANPAAGIAQCQAWLASTYPYFPNLALAPASVTSPDTNDPNLQVPYTTQISFGVQHQYTGGMTVSADFIHSRGQGLLYFDGNHQVEADGTVINTDPRFGTVSVLKRAGFIHYTALQLQAHYRTKKATFGIAYTLAKADSDLAAGGGDIFGSSPTNPFDLSEDNGPADTDQRHNLVVNASYTLPWEIQLSGIGTYRSPLPWTVETDLNPTNAYYPPLPDGKNTMRGYDYKSVDIRIAKAVRLGRGMQASLFWETFNLFNWLNLNSIDNLLQSSTFGLPTSASDMRRQQLGIRFDF
jgi:hypothetical protein